MNLKKACLRNSALKDLKILVAIFCGVLSTLLPVRSSDNPNVKIGYRPIKGPAPVPKPTPAIDEIPIGYPADNGVDEAKLIDLAKWIKSDTKLRIYSLLVSKNGKLIFELYTPGIEREQSHYLMSVTKSILSTLVGIAIDQKKIPSETTALDQIIPENLFASKSDKTRFSKFNLKDVMGMQCLNVIDVPRNNTAEAWARFESFMQSRNRFQFALTNPTQNPAKKTLIYNDQGPMIASGILSYRTGLSAFDFGQEYLFKPLGFKNAEWCHQDPSGINMGGYGLRLRPIDMQKLGIMFLKNGKWNNKQVVSQEWAYKTSMPYTGDQWGHGLYGYYWWSHHFDTTVRWQHASGWRGQMIALNRGAGVVVTMTACIEDGSEFTVFDKIMKDYITPSINPSRKTLRIKEYDEVIKSVNSGVSRISYTESRMVPSRQPKETAIKFKGILK